MLPPLLVPPFRKIYVYLDFRFPFLFPRMRVMGLPSKTAFLALLPVFFRLAPACGQPVPFAFHIWAPPPFPCLFPTMGMPCSLCLCPERLFYFLFVEISEYPPFEIFPDSSILVIYCLTGPEFPYREHTSFQLWPFEITLNRKEALPARNGMPQPFGDECPDTHPH